MAREAQERKPIDAAEGVSQVARSVAHHLMVQAARNVAALAIEGAVRGSALVAALLSC